MCVTHHDMPLLIGTEAAENKTLVCGPNSYVNLRQTCTLKHIDRSANAFISHVTTRDDNSAMLLASPNTLTNVVRRYLLSINGNATPIALPLYVRNKRNVVTLAFGSRRNQTGHDCGSQEQKLFFHGSIMRYYTSTRNVRCCRPVFVAMQASKAGPAAPT